MCAKIEGAFVDAGFVALTFDYRGFGGSEGEKWRLIPLEQIDDSERDQFLRRRNLPPPEQVSALSIVDRIGAATPPLAEPSDGSAV